MSEPIKPKACPFCGEPPEIETVAGFHLRHSPDCILQGVCILRRIQIESWNTRPAEREAEKRGVQACIEAVKEEAPKWSTIGIVIYQVVIRKLESLLK